MILRKPFAFLIKNFRMLHFIMLFFMIYIMYACSAIMSFLKEYLGSTLTLINHDVILTLYKNLLYISLFGIFIFTIIILILMFLKKKPVKLYLYNILTYIFTLVIIIISKKTISTLEISLVEVRTLKLLQDLILITLIFQFISCVLTIIRTTGFDIKKFDFAKDLAELNIEEQDSEEFEVNIEFDNDRYLRKIKKILRYIKYIYIENKYIFSIAFSLVIGITCLITYLNLSIYNKTYKENETLSTNNFYFNIVESYVTNKDYKGNVIDKNYSFVVVKLKSRTIANKSQKLPIAQIPLNVNNHNFYHTTDYKEEFSDLGIYYNDDDITNDFKEYLLIYKIPNSYIDDKKIIYFYNSNFKKIKIKINSNKIDDNIIENNFNLGEEISLEKSIFKKSSIIINSYEIKESFDISYNFCISNDCNLSHEIIKPKLNTNYDKVLLKVNGNYKIDSSLSINKPQKLFDLIEKCGSILYKINDNDYKFSSLTEITSKKIIDNNNVYLEVPKEVMNSTEIRFVIKLRNMVYIYTLK